MARDRPTLLPLPLMSSPSSSRLTDRFDDTLGDVLLHIPGVASDDRTADAPPRRAPSLRRRGLGALALRVRDALRLLAGRRAARRGVDRDAGAP